ATSASSICPGCLRSLTIRSLPMLPEPRIATLTRLPTRGCGSIQFLRTLGRSTELRKRHRHFADRVELGAISLACRYRGGGTHGAWQDDRAGHGVDIIFREFIRQPGARFGRVAQHSGTGARANFFAVA